jgi:ABC-type transporter Mla subunit MlaD
MFGIGMGSSSTENQLLSGLQSLAGYDTSKGQSATNQGLNFWSSILSGDPSKISQLLGPQISTMQKQGQQAKQTAAQFGNRSGGTNASMQTVDDTTRANVDTMIGNLTGSAATNLSNMGMNLLSQGGSNLNSAFNAANTIQQQNSAQWNDIFKSIAQVATGFVGGM